MTEGWPDRILAAVPGRAVAEQLASEVRWLVSPADGVDETRLDLQKVCEMGGFEPRIVPLRSGIEAMLLPCRDGRFVICADPTRGMASRDIRRHRVRFRLAHEIGHSFFYDRRAAPPQRTAASSAAEEQFCHRFASSLLLPPAAVARETVDPRTLFRLSDRYDVSLHAAAHALAAAHRDTSVMFLQWQPSPRTGKLGMRIVWTASRAFVPKGARLVSTAVEDAQRCQRACRVEELAIGGLRGWFRVAVQTLRRTMSMLVVVRQEAEGGSGITESTVAGEQLLLPVHPSPA